MYHINRNNPPVESVSVIRDPEKNTASLSAALVTDGSLPPVDRRRQKVGTRSITLGRSMTIRRPESSSPDEVVLHESGPCITVVACSDPYQTLDPKRASPYYMRIDLSSVSESTSEREREKDQASRNKDHFVAILPDAAPARSLNGKSKRSIATQGLAIHTVLPIPKHHLEGLIQSHRDFLHGYLVVKRYEPGSELSRRVKQTLEMIGEVTEEHETHV